jgi:hypothetical protein
MVLQSCAFIFFSFQMDPPNITRHFVSLCRQGTQSQGDENLFLSYIQSMEFITFSLWGSFIFPLQARRVVQGR